RLPRRPVTWTVSSSTASDDAVLASCALEVAAARTMATPTARAWRCICRCDFAPRPAARFMYFDIQSPPRDKGFFQLWGIARARPRVPAEVRERHVNATT